jgi:hypothetical protein
MKLDDHVVLRQLLVQHLDRVPRLHQHVLGQEHAPHAALAEELEHAILPDLCADHGWQAPVGSPGPPVLGASIARSLGSEAEAGQGLRIDSVDRSTTMSRSRAEHAHDGAAICSILRDRKARWPCTTNKHNLTATSR